MVDVGSTDQSGVVCDEYRKQHPHKIRVFHKKNEGLLITRRFGIQKATGKYFVFVDSDDYVSPLLLETIDKALNENEADMIIYGYSRFVDGTNDMFTPEPIFFNGTVIKCDEKETLYQKIVESQVFCNMWVKAVARDIVDIDFDYTPYNAAYGEDIIQSLPLFDRAKKIVVLNDILYYYRKNINSITMSVKFSNCMDCLAETVRMEYYMNKWNIEAGIRNVYYTKQVNRMYGFLRALHRQEKVRNKEFPQMRDSFRRLSKDIRFINLLEKYNPNYDSLRIQWRLWILKRSILTNNWFLFIKLMNFSNIGKL